ncbi:hypothetical protein TESS_TESS_02399 [Tessaracoccus sp. O5.2]|jgi:sensor c-di-GMP phosphodiesterase-like protein|uniref:DUF3618 domain-containing protein n=1 Tax=Tessaracoccus TaxID=72763 RepID=UPI001146E4CA|nr:MULTISPECIES: DUF3618 domain-containing protein [Tessaracoccus]VEP39338.1 hypothetical protein TLA_TLA_00751 [Tessaracoccus lapidicaptus]
MSNGSNRSVEDIRADLAANRAKLAQAASDAVESVKPANIARAALDETKLFAKTEFEAVASQVRDDEGGWRTDRLLAIGGAVLGLVVFAVTINSIAKRRTSLEARARRAISG